MLASSQTSAKLEVEDSYPLGDNIHEIATHLYDGLRKYKQGDVDLIICEAFSDSGVGQAVMNRLQKAATEYIVEGI